MGLNPLGLAYCYETGNFEPMPTPFQNTPMVKIPPRFVALCLQVLFEKSQDIGGVWGGHNYAGYGAQVKREQCLRPQRRLV